MTEILKSSIDEKTLLDGHYDKVYKLGVYEEDFPIEPEDLAEHYFQSITPNGIIFNAGCGSGRQSNYMQERGFAIIGVDRSSEAIASSRRNYPGIAVAQLDILQTEEFLPVQIKMDAVYEAFVDQHLTDEESDMTFEIFARLTKPGGMLYIATQIADSDVPQEIHTARPDEGGSLLMRLRVPEQIVSRLENVGFKTLETFTREPRIGEHQCKKFYLRAVRVEENTLSE